MARPIAKIVTVLAAASALTGCPQDDPSAAADSSSGPATCGTTSCIDRVHVSFSAASDQLAAGSYAIAWANDGVDDDCSFTIAVEPDACGGDPPCALDDECDADFGFVAQPQFVALDIPGKPMLVELTALRDDAVVFQDGFPPQYTDVQPNGEDCPPTCALAEASFDLP